MEVGDTGSRKLIKSCPGVFVVFSIPRPNFGAIGQGGGKNMNLVALLGLE